MIFTYAADNAFHLKIFNHGQVLKFSNLLQFKVDPETIGSLTEGTG